MSAQARQAAYDIHGLHLAVTADDPAVAEAVGQRLSSFATDAATSPDLRFIYRVSGAGGAPLPERPAGPSRVVYDAPDGAVLYDAEADVLHAEFGGLRFRCDAGKGTV